MSARILDGARIAEQIKAEVAREVRELAAAGVVPGLATIVSRGSTASNLYLHGRIRACQQAGIGNENIVLPQNATTDDAIVLVRELNLREDVDGIVVQLPVPEQVNWKLVERAVDPAKDVDGFHPMNLGMIAAKRPGLVPCTAAGVIELLKRSGIGIAGTEAVIVGRSDIVGRPLAMLLTNQDATTTLAHSKTRNLAEVCRRADILAVAIGRPGFITREFVKPGATVVDIGINRISDRAEFDKFFRGDSQREQEFAAKGWTIMGDVDPKVAEVASAITPVPGGVGPLTVAMLMVNTVRAARMRRGSAVETSRERGSC